MTTRIERFAPISLFVVLVIALVLRLWSIDFGLTTSTRLSAGLRDALTSAFGRQETGGRRR
jgi:hypothetical protein